MAVTPYKQRIPLDMGLLEILSQRFEQLAADPAVLVNGNVWYNTSEHRLKRVENGVVVPFFSAADAVKLAGYQTAIDDAEADILALTDELAAISSDNILSKHEKPVIKFQYDLLIAEQIGIDEIATQYGITTEKTNYDNAITALTAYMVSLNPLYTDYTQDTVIVGSTFRQKFGDVYTTRQILTNSMSDYAYETLQDAIAVADEAKATADAAQADATAALLSIGAIAVDAFLSKAEKPALVQQYNVLVNERAGIDAQATAYGITTEKTNYDNAVIALIAYITGLSPAYNDYTQDTAIVRTDFNTAFELVYSTRQILLNTIYEEAKELADDAAIIARSKGKHFISEPTTPYYVGDIYTNSVDLYRCIVERLVGAYNAADWEIATHYDRTKTIIDGGLITTGRVEVGGGALGTGNAGINGSVGVDPNLDIRFWAGADYAHRTTAPFRVQNDGTFYAVVGNIGGWTVDADSLYSGTKVSGDGYAVNAGDMTIKSDGSIHSKNFYINADGEVSFRGVASFQSAPSTYGGQQLSMSILGFELWENNASDDNGAIWINRVGFNGGDTKYRDTWIGNGRGSGYYMARFLGHLNTAEFACKAYFYDSVIIDGPGTYLQLPSMNLVQARYLRDSGSPVQGMMIFVSDWGATGQFAGYMGTDFYNFTMNAAMA